MTEKSPKHFNFLKSLFKKQINNNELIEQYESSQLSDTFLDHYLTFIKNHPDIILFFSQEGKVLTENKARINKTLGYRPERKVNYKELLSRAEYTWLRAAFIKSTKGTTETVESHVYNKQEELLYFTGTFIPIVTPKGEIEGVLLILKDTSHLKRLEKSHENKRLKLIETNDTYRYIFDHLNSGIWMADSLTGKVTYASHGLEKIMRKPIKTILDNPHYWESMVTLEDRDELQKKYQLLGKGQSFEHSYHIIDGNGNLKWVHEQTIPKMNEEGEVTHLFGMIRDITSKKTMQKEIEFLAKNDALTSLPNYYSLHERLNDLIDQPQIKTLALLYIDLDDFDWVFNYLGHEFSEKVITEVASRLNVLRNNKKFIAKIDNDTFVILVPSYYSKGEIFHLAENIIEKIQEQIEIDGYEFHITASIGMSFYPDDADSHLPLLENARSALYHAKQLGKNNYQIYSSHIDIDSHKKYVLEKDLRKAIKDEDFEVYYQPQVNPRSGVIEAAEALIRWNHKEWGVVSPADFIPLAEEKHLIHEIEDWIIKEVCRQLKEWKDKGYELYPISINMSPMRFLKPGIIETLKRELKAYNIPAKYIEVEISEISFSNIETNIEDTITGLKELGVKLALDDFGTGYSILNYLQKFEFDKMKIDIRFIRDLHAENKKDVAIVSSFLLLAKGLDMKMVAQGVEEHDQLEFLKQNECDLVQGYLFARPVSAREFEKMMKKRYLKPIKKRPYIKPERERRKYFRFQFPGHLPANMNLIEVNKQKVSMGGAHILIENIGLGGIRFLSRLRLPVKSNIKLTFKLKLMDDIFDLKGLIVYKNEEKLDVFSYGVSFNINEGEKDRLAEMINKMTVFKKVNSQIPDTDFIDGDPYLYLTNHISK